jgi:hypothetical protein
VTIVIQKEKERERNSKISDFIKIKSHTMAEGYKDLLGQLKIVV